jgi:hypothetical protein
MDGHVEVWSETIDLKAKIKAPTHSDIFICVFWWFWDVKSAKSKQKQQITGKNEYLSVEFTAKRNIPIWQLRPP